MKKTREYQASQILKKKLLNKFLWLSRVNTIVKWTIMVLLTGMIIYFSLVNSGAILDKSTKPISDYDQVLFAKNAFYWPLIVAFVYMLAVFIESILSWEARNRQKRGYVSAGFENMNLVAKRTIIRMVVHVLTIIVVAILFGWWFHIIDGVYPNTRNIFFDSGLGGVEVGNISSAPIRVFAALFVSMTVILLVISISYVTVASILLFKSRKNIIMYNQIKGTAIDSLLVQTKESK